MAPLDLSSFASTPHAEWGRRDLAAAMKKAGIPAMSLCVIQGDDLSCLTLGGNDTDLFQVSALTEAVFSVLCLKLAEEKKIDLHRDISRSPLTRQILTHPRFEGSVTLAQLLSHTAGLNLSTLPGYRKAQPFPTLAQSLLGQAPAKNAPLRRVMPQGTLSEHSGGGYLLAQAIVEEAMSQDLESLAQTYVFSPLGMQHSTFAADPAGSVLPGHGHFRRQIPGGWLRYPQLLWSCTQDMGQFIRIFGKNCDFLKNESRESLLHPYHKSQFSFGLTCDSVNGHTCLQSGGGTQGYQAKFRFFPGEDRGFIFIASAHSAFRTLVATQYALYDSLGWPYLPRPEETKRRPYTHADQV